MIYTTEYKSDLGNIFIAAENDKIIGVWLEGQKYFASTIKESVLEARKIPVLRDACNWLDAYFRGEKPTIEDLPLAPAGSAFRQEVWSILCEIPYGEVTTYGEIARKMAERLGRKNMSAQAVGGAVGHNPISIIIPCHRVVGSNGSLTGYAGGIDKKIALLAHEGVDVKRFYIP